MNVENLEVGRYFKRNKNKKGRIKVKSEEREIKERTTPPQVKNTIGLGCIIIKTKHHAE